MPDPGPMTEETPLTKHTRNIDETLARFSAVHDEAHAELIEKERRRGKLGKMINRFIDDDEPFDEGDPPTTTIQATPAPPKRRFARRPGKPVPVDDDASEVDDLAADDVADFHQDSERTEFSALDADPEDEPPTSVKAKTVVPAPQLKLTARQRAGRATAVILAAIVFVVTGFGWGARGWVDNQFREISALDNNSDLVNQPEKQYGDENFLIVGSDSRAGAEAGDNVGTTEDHDGALADVVMIAHIPASRERLVMVSFTRDLEVSRPECQRWDPQSGDYVNETVPAQEITKLNAVYGVGGPQCLREVVQEISGLSFSRFVGIDFSGFREMVDAVDGVEICTPISLIDQELGTVIPDPGQQEIDGATALNYVRARKIEGDPTGDYGRMHRQQLFLSSLLRKVMSAEVLLDPGQLTGFVRAFANNTFGENITVDGLMTLGQSLQQLETDRVTFVTLPTVGEANERGSEVMLEDDIDALFQAIIDDQPLPDEAGSDEGDDAAAGGDDASAGDSGSADSGDLLSPDGIKIQVLNASDIGGAAGSVASAMTDLGFDVVLQGNAPAPVEATTIRYAPQRAAEAATLAATLNNAVLEEDPSAGGAVSLLIGPDYDGTVQEPGLNTASANLGINPSAVGPGAGEGETEEDSNEVPENLETINAGTAGCSFWAGG